MGFGSYDESEQQKHNQNNQDEEDFSEESNLRDAEHNGEVNFNLGSTDEAIERLKNITGEGEDEESEDEEESVQEAEDEEEN